MSIEHVLNHLFPHSIITNPSSKLFHPILHPFGSTTILYYSPYQIPHALLHSSPGRPLIHFRSDYMILRPMNRLCRLFSFLQDLAPKLITHTLKLSEFRHRLQFAPGSQFLNENIRVGHAFRVVICEKEINVWEI